MIAIENVTRDDLPLLAPIYVEAYNALKIGETWTDSTAMKLLTNFFDSQADLFFVAKSDGEIVGAIVAIVKPWCDGNRLTDGEFFVKPGMQGKGIGTLLIRHMFQKAYEKYQAISWDTFTHRIHEYPLNWYKKIGFEEIKEWVMITGDVKKVLSVIGNAKNDRKE